MFIIDVIASTLINANIADYSCSTRTLDRRDCVVIVIDNTQVSK